VVCLAVDLKLSVSSVSFNSSLARQTKTAVIDYNSKVIVQSAVVEKNYLTVSRTPGLASPCLLMFCLIVLLITGN